MVGTLQHSAHSSTLSHGVYVRNICALWRFDARLAMALDAVHPDDIPSTEPAKDNAPTIRVASFKGPLYLHSRYKPLQEAQSWADSIPLESKYVFIVAGFALGHHLRALWEKLPEDAMVIVSEPNIPLLRAAFAALDYSDLLDTGRLLIFSDLDRGALVERLEPRSVLLVSGTQFATHPPSVQLQPDFHGAFQKLFTEFAAFTRTGFMTLMLNNVATCCNIANNIGCYVTSPPIDTMHNAFAGIPAVLVAAGPSLQKNMHLLHEIKGEAQGVGRRAVIIAVQTMLKPLLAAGIQPDFVTSLDYNTVSTRFFENLEEAGGTGQTHLVAEAKANWNVLDVFRGGGDGGEMSIAQNDFADRLLRGAFPKRMGLKAGATVAHLSFYLAEFLGCEPLILIGQDLGFVDGLYYKPGVAIHETWAPELSRFNTLETKEWERIARSRAILRQIPDIHGHPMYTEEQFFVYLQQFERDFAASRCRVIDATEGGARKQHVTLMSFRQAIDQFCSSPSAARSSISFPWRNWSCDTIANLQRAKEALTAQQQSAQNMVDTCNATVPLLEEMQKHQSDETRMNKLFIEVDRLRGKVGDDPQTFEMVCHLNTTSELRRFQDDLAVKTAKKDPLERQKRQLIRDVEYVKGLRVGAKRLVEILAESLRRLDRQIEATRTRQPWPREVAGS